MNLKKEKLGLKIDKNQFKTIDFNRNFNSKNQHIKLPILQTKKIQLYLKREDLIHPFVSGNKFRKLKYNLQEAKNQEKKTLLTFGGAFSNHIVATAVAANASGFNAIGVIRGDELAQNIKKVLTENSTLKEAYNYGMTFEFISREMYRNKSNKKFINQLKEKFGNFYLIPEGGTNDFAIKGCEEILTEQDKDFNYICCAVGTGGTIAGLINASQPHQQIIGFPALKGNFLKNEIQKFTKSQNWSLQTNYHFGGYAKHNKELIDFINNFKKETTILLDPIYTGKMMFGILNLIENNRIPENSKILAIHTGGIQGIAGFNQKLIHKNKETIIVL